MAIMMLIAALVGLLLFAQFSATISSPLGPVSSPDKLLALQPTPEFLVVYPEPGQTLGLSVSSQDVIVANPIPAYLFELPFRDDPTQYICALFIPDKLLDLTPGIFRSRDNIVPLIEMTLDGHKTPLDWWADWLMGRFLMDIEGKVTAGIGGPYSLCWRGSKHWGYHIATFSFEQYSYTWWYKIEK